MPSIQEILTGTTFRQVPGKFVYAKLTKSPEDPSIHFLVSFDQDEITVITKVENYKNLKALERNKDNYALFELRVSVPFYAVGFLAKVTSSITGKGTNVLVVSTYSKDYILVRTEAAELARQAFLDLEMEEAAK